VKEKNAQIMMKVGNDYETKILNIIYDNSHFELVEYCFWIMNNSNVNIEKLLLCEKWIK